MQICTCSSEPASCPQPPPPSSKFPTQPSLLGAGKRAQTAGLPVLKYRDGALRYEAWYKEIPIDYPYREWILTGVKEGFHILDVNSAFSCLSSPVHVKNYNSAILENKSLCEAQINEEIANGRYCVTPNPPLVISALGAIKKDNNKVRLIHDASRPAGESLNDFCEKERFQYECVQDAVTMITPGCWMAKVDLQSAYRSVKVHPSNYPFTGLSWTFEGDCEPTFLFDTRLCFGARRAPFVFNHLTQSVKAMMQARGYKGIVCFLDDFLIIDKQKEVCQQAVQILVKLLRELGFSINYDKMVMPSQCLTFLGININSVEMNLKLPADKLMDIHSTIASLINKRKATKKELQRLAGKLAFANQCVYGGVFFVRRLHDSIAKLHNPYHRTRITRDMRDDMEWWMKFLDRFNGEIPMMDTRPTTPVFTDACNVSAGAIYEHEFVYTPWNLHPDHEDLHINYKETLAIMLALQHWSTRFRNKHVIVYCDNQTAVAIINKGSSRNKIVMSALRDMFWLSACNNFRIHAIYYPGSENRCADAVSRLHEYPVRDWHKLGISVSHFRAESGGKAARLSGCIVPGCCLCGKH